MNLKINVCLEEDEKDINREIEVNDNLSLELFSEYLITIMNGKVKHIYFLCFNDKNYVPKRELVSDNKTYLMKDKTIANLNLKENDKLELYYDENAGWKFIIEVVKIEKSKKEKDFQVLSGIGRGIIEDLDVFYDLKVLSNPNLSEEEKKYYERVIPTAISITFPRMMNSLNSSKKPFPLPFTFSNFSFLDIIPSPLYLL